MTSDVGVMAAVIVMLALAVAASVAGVLGHGRALVTAGVRAVLHSGCWHWCSPLSCGRCG